MMGAAAVPTVVVGTFICPGDGEKPKVKGRIGCLTMILQRSYVITGMNYLVEEGGYLIMVTWRQSQDEYIKRASNVSTRCLSNHCGKRSPERP